MTNICTLESIMDDVFVRLISASPSEEARIKKIYERFPSAWRVDENPYATIRESSSYGIAVAQMKVNEWGGVDCGDASLVLRGLKDPLNWDGFLSFDSQEDLSQEDLNPQNSIEEWAAYGLSIHKGWPAEKPEGEVDLPGMEGCGEGAYGAIIQQCLVWAGEDPPLINYTDVDRRQMNSWVNSWGVDRSCLAHEFREAIKAPVQEVHKDRKEVSIELPSKAVYKRVEGRSILLSITGPHDPVLGVFQEHLQYEDLGGDKYRLQVPKGAGGDAILRAPTRIDMGGVVYTVYGVS